MLAVLMSLVPCGELTVIDAVGDLITNLVNTDNYPYKNARKKKKNSNWDENHLQSNLKLSMDTYNTLQFTFRVSTMTAHNLSISVPPSLSHHLNACLQWAYAQTTLQR